MNQILHGDSLEVLKTIPDKSVQTCVTSPPYFGLRDYGVEGQIGLEETPEQYVQKLVELFREVRRVLRDDGTLWLNLGDSYWANRASNGQSYDDNEVQRKRSGGKNHGTLKPKDLIGIPWRVAFALQADGWYLRQDIIWHKPNPMPESVTDRCTKAHEYVFLLSKSKDYYYDHEAVMEPFADERMGNPNGGGHYAREAFKYAGPNAQSGLQKGKWNEDGKAKGRNKRSVWTVTTKPYKGAHFATFPPDLIEPCVLAGAPVGGVVLDPFLGSGTTAAVAVKHGRRYIGIELNKEYIKLAEQRLEATQIKLAA